MNKYIYMAAAAAGILALGACSDDTEALSGQGSAKLSPSITTDVAITESRSTDAELREELSESFMLWISNSKGVVRAYNGLENVPDEVSLLSGSYLAEAWAGDSVSASWDKRWFKGEQPFEIANGVVTRVNIDCAIANVVVSVEYDPTVDDVLSDYTLTVGHSRGSLTFDAEHAADRAYFMMPSADKNLNWTLTGKEKGDGATIFTRTNIIENVQPGHHYIFKVSCATDAGEDIGGAFLNIVIDDTAIEASETVEIAVAPIITGYHFNIDKPVYATPGTIGRRSFYVSATSAIKSVIVETAALEKVFGAGKKDFDAMLMDDEVRSQLLAAGVKTTYNYDEEQDAATLKITFEEEFTNTIDADGNYDFTFTATDAADKTSVKTWALNVSTEPVVIDPIDVTIPAADDPAVWSTEATLSGNLMNVEAYGENPTVKVMYASTASRADWQSVDATIEGDKYFAKVTGLVPATTYQFYATITSDTGEEFATDPATFTTDGNPQLPNASFEDWQTSSAPYLIYAQGQSMFWDSGNHGSATMKKNVTVPNDKIVHSGKYSVELASQFVGIGSIGKFAAGNIFVGEYLKTDGTDGVLGWGRAFTSRPKAVRGYVKYDPVPIDRVDASAPQYKAGDMDNGIIYVALMDDNLQTFENKKYPVIVKTKTKELFDPQSDLYKPHVIAYGQLVWTAATDGLIEFEVPLEYYDLTRRPSYIVLTASASKGGDYFCGGNGSKMILDDIELVY